MILLGNLMITLASIFYMISQVFVFILIAKVIISWLNPDPYNPIVRFIDSCTDPIFSWIRRKLKLTVGRIDFTPLILLVLVVVFQGLVVGSLHDYGTLIKSNSTQGVQR